MRFWTTTIGLILFGCLGASQATANLLHEAVRDGDLATAERLLMEAGAHSISLVNEPESSTGHTPLHLAAMSGNTPMVILLLSQGAKANAEAALSPGLSLLLKCGSPEDTRGAPIPDPSTACLVATTPTTATESAVTALQEAILPLTAQPLPWWRTPYSTSRAKTGAFSALGAAAAGACVIMVGPTLPVIAPLAVLSGAATGYGLRQKSRQQSTQSEFQLSMDSALARAHYLHRSALSPSNPSRPSLLTLKARQGEIGADLLRSQLVIGETPLEKYSDESPSDHYHRVFQALKTKVMEVTSLSEKAPETMLETIIGSQVRLILETCGQLYDSSGLSEAVFHSLPRIGQSQEGAYDFEDYMNRLIQAKKSPIVPKNDTRENSPHTIQFEIQASPPKVTLVSTRLSLFLNTNTSGGGDPTTLPYRMHYARRIEFPLITTSADLKRSGLIMPVATIQYRVEAVPTASPADSSPNSSPNFSGTTDE